MDVQRFPKIVASIYELVDELERMFPGRHFTPESHMLRSLGEALAAFHYGVKLDTASALCHDGRCEDRNVQVKATQTDRIGISSQPEYLLVFAIRRDGTFQEIYNGPGGLVWNLVSHKPLPKNGQYQVPLSKLSTLMREVPHAQRRAQA